MTWMHCQEFNPYVTEMGIFWVNFVSTMAADGLAPCVTRSSATIGLTAGSSSKKDFQYLSQSWEKNKKCKNVFLFLKMNSAWKGLTLKHRETYGFIVSTVATDALVLQHQVINILNAD